MKREDIQPGDEKYFPFQDKLYSPDPEMGIHTPTRKCTSHERGVLLNALLFSRTEFDDQDVIEVNDYA